jgi:DinB superfamily
MINATVKELQRRNDAAREALPRPLEGMEAHLELADAPGEWTAREVLCHLLFEPGWTPVALLERFATGDLGAPPLVEITAGSVTVTPERRRRTLAELVAALDAQRREVFEYLETLGEADLARKARIPLFAPILGTDEVPLPVFVGAMFDRHWVGHAEQLAKIRRAAGLPETQYTTSTPGETR